MRDPDGTAEGRGAPLVGRPRGASWRALQADGVEWEGQVLLIGADVDLAARVIVTQRRLAFARGCAVVLDVPRAWLRPLPTLRADGSVVVTVSAEDAPESQRIVLRLRDGHPATHHLLDLLGGAGYAARARSLDAESGGRRPARVLPPLPEPARPSPPSSRAEAAPDAAASLPRGDASPTLGDQRWRPAPPHEPFADRPPGGLKADAVMLEPVVRPGPPPAAIGRDRDWNLPPLGGMVPRAARRRRGWSLRLGGLVLLLALAAFVGSGRAPSVFDRRFDDGSANGIGGPEPTTAAQVLGPTETTAEAAEPSPTAVPSGIGGIAATETVPVAPSPVPSEAPPTIPAPSPTEAIPAGTEGPTKTPRPSAAQTAEPKPEPTTEPTPEPTAEPAREPTIVPTAEPTAEPTPEPTVPAATARPSAVPPATASPTDTPAAEEAAETPPAAPAPTAAAILGPPAPGSATEGAIASPPEAPPAGLLAVEVEVAERGASLPNFGLPPSADGDWLAVVVRARNEGEAEVRLSLSDVRLRGAPSEPPIPLDDVTGVVADLLRLDPAANVGDVVGLGPGEERRLALVFQLPAESGATTLLVGETSIELGPSLGGIGGTESAVPPTPTAELIETRVARVLDGERIEVDLDGEPTRVRYLGINAPVGGSCYAAASARANAALVDGQTVWLEQQTSDDDLSGALLRDVWVADETGERVLVSLRLAEQGAVRLDPNDPDLRYAEPIAAAALAAEERGAGLWDACAGANSADRSATTSSRAFAVAVDVARTRSTRSSPVDVPTTRAGDRPRPAVPATTARGTVRWP